ncbi:MAG: M1 family aminopeptidase [Streptosporangiaceae bacterium]
MPALTEAEARTRASLLDIESCQLFLDLTGEPVRSRSEIRFGCRQPGAATFADLTATMTGAELNGRRLGPPVDGRLSLPALRPVNVLTVEAEADYAGIGRGLTRFRDPADGAGYVSITCYPTHAPAIFGCFDQPDLSARTGLQVAAPAGWEGLGNGPVLRRPPAGQAGVWEFGAVAMRPFEVAVCAGPFTMGFTSGQPAGGGGRLAMTVRRRQSLAGADGVAGLGRFGAVARDVIERYRQVLGVPCPYPNYDIVFLPDLSALAYSVPGLMLVNESLLARMADPDDDFVAMVNAHEVAHLWFGGLVGMRWWDDVWLDEAIATYLSYLPGTGTAGPEGSWTAFCYRDKERAYQADELPGREPVSAPVADAGVALSKPAAITYAKGASVVRQLGALIGEQALHAGLGRYLTRYRAGGVADLDDLVGCWSQASGRELAGWAGEWLRTEGAPLVRPELTVTPDGTIGSAAVLQDIPRTHRIGIGLYDRDGTGLRRRRLVSVQVSGARTEVPGLAGERRPAALVLNDGDLSYARVGFDDATFQALAAAAMDVGDPLTEAVCWNAAWHMVSHGELAAADLAALIIRRAADLPLAGTEVLLERAVACADVFAPPGDRAGIREQVAGTAARLAGQAGPGSPQQRALAEGFATAAQSDGQLRLLRAWLTGDGLPAGLVLTAGLRRRILGTLAARGLASDADLDTLARLDPVQGEQHRATCQAMRPDPADKETAWMMALAADGDWRLAQAHAQGLWVPGQEELMAGYLDRYLSQALPAVDGREPRLMRGLARLLYPATLIAPGTLAATAAALRGSRLSGALQVIVRERDAILRSALTARAVPRRPGAGW